MSMDSFALDQSVTLKLETVNAIPDSQPSSVQSTQTPQPTSIQKTQIPRGSIKSDEVIIPQWHSFYRFREKGSENRYRAKPEKLEFHNYIVVHWIL
ncbi:hypothetical protein Mp_Vg00280 [Marchantia polymorpha subsp. ruderalis]|uniref:Uncharacterized protein n=1 Tax=Marchantia polymorpha TaxID=3197 RepID=A0A2R6VWU0_MARPO|nr:hypothetical protein MARPO_YB0023 [Marchantia polymorpha]BBN20481.1 hypothetical protein Mp_Vg00280 [Marchantia polymorpha subsp. ruderalis]|eukprot:PTQ26075.1 hypothetical protein MARPO_YB0023 [Marchantia polymorpha]